MIRILLSRNLSIFSLQGGIRMPNGAGQFQTCTATVALKKCTYMHHREKIDRWYFSNSKWDFHTVPDRSKTRGPSPSNYLCFCSGGPKISLCTKMDYFPWSAMSKSGRIPHTYLPGESRTPLRSKHPPQYAFPPKVDSCVPCKCVIEAEQSSHQHSPGSKYARTQWTRIAIAKDISSLQGNAKLAIRHSCLHSVVQFVSDKQAVHYWEVVYYPSIHPLKLNGDHLSTEEEYDKVAGRF